MRTNESDIHKLRTKLDYNHKPIIIPFNIKHIVLISYVVNTIKSMLYISEIGPLASLDFLNPFLERSFCLWMPFSIFPQRFLCEYPHIFCLS